MAQKVNVILVDDIDGSAAIETVKFGLEGTEYEIDLNADHAEELRQLTARYIAKARKITGSGRRQTRSRSAAENATDPRKIRDWAKGEGIKVNDRGRVPANIVARYETANSR
jgi:hypothetical protein